VVNENIIVNIMSSESSRDRLPFEPRQKKKKPVKKTVNTTQNNPVSSSKAEKSTSAYDSQNASLSSIPDEVSKRMVKRMAYFSGIPTAMGIFSFFIFYWIVKQEWFEVPNSAVVFVSMGLFGLGVVGLTYGLLSASWDEGHLGGFWGWKEFKVNLGRMTSAWRSARQETLAKKRQTANDE
jgi:hypothetical protein